MGLWESRWGYGSPDGAMRPCIQSRGVNDQSLTALNDLTD